MLANLEVPCNKTLIVIGKIPLIVLLGDYRQRSLCTRWLAFLLRTSHHSGSMKQQCTFV
jgi:hypothetical protein